MNPPTPTPFHRATSYCATTLTIATVAGIWWAWARLAGGRAGLGAFAVSMGCLSVVWFAVAMLAAVLDKRAEGRQR